MASTYKRPTRIIELPSGKKIEAITFFASFESEEIEASMLEGIAIKNQDFADSQSDNEEVRAAAQARLNGAEIPLRNMLKAFQKAKVLAARKLIDENGEEYPATEENLREFLTASDGEFFAGEIKKMIDESKKK